jgi:hypothetical protein
VDTAAAVVPGAPGGAGTAIKASRAGEKVASAISAADKAAAAAKAAKGTDRAADAGKTAAGTAAKGAKPKPGSAGGEGAGKRFSEKVKEKARAESGGKCVFCGKDTTKQAGPSKSEIDHAIPKSRGGNNSPENAQNTCRTCNREKGKETTEEFVKDR